MITMPTMKRPTFAAPLRLSRMVLSCVFLITAAYPLCRRLVSRLFTPSHLPKRGKCLVSHGKYNGFIYKSTESGSMGSGSTIANQCLVESKWMRISQHSVKFHSNDVTRRVIDDWLWIDYHDRVNVLVEAPKINSDDVGFLILEQTKYALNSQLSLAVVGGIIEPPPQNIKRMEATEAEAPLMAAKREVLEETNLICKEWIQLGKFRTDVNRGMGWVFPFLAQECSYLSNNATFQEQLVDTVGTHDSEKQNILKMKLKDLRAAVIEGKFLEVQWSNTVALAMLYLDSK